MIQFKPQDIEVAPAEFSLPHCTFCFQVKIQSIWLRYDVDGININKSDLFKYVRNLGYNKVELNVDSMVVAKILKNKDGGNPMGRSFVSLIRRMLDLEWKVTIKQCFREINRCADALATFGCSLE
ncbi:hypothetical protein L195_g053052, partial [Trifolium pratense]